MDSALEDVLRHIECGELRNACIMELLDVYYQCITLELGERPEDVEEFGTPFPKELCAEVENRNCGIGSALMHLLNAGHDVNADDGIDSPLVLAVEMADAPMVHFLIDHGADAARWPEMEEERLPWKANYYLDDIDIKCLSVYWESSKDTGYLEALCHTAVVLSKEGHLGPYCGICLTIEDDGTVSTKPPKMKY